MHVGLFDALDAQLAYALDLRQAQHGLTASNLANANTPGFHAQVVPFAELMAKFDEEEVMRSEEKGIPFQGEIQIVELEPPPWAMDGNSVLAEREASRLTENALAYQGVSQGLGKRLAILKYAASDGAA